MRVRCRARAHVREFEGLVKAEHVASQDHIIRNTFKKSAKRTPNSFSMRPEGRSQSAPQLPQALCSRTAEHTRSFLPTVMSYLSKVVGERLEGKIECFGGARPNRLGSGRKSLFGPHRRGVLRGGDMGTDTPHVYTRLSKACSWLFSVSIASVLRHVQLALDGTLADDQYFDRSLQRCEAAACPSQLDAACCCWLRLLGGPILGTLTTLRVTCVRVSCGAAQADLTLAPRAARGPPVAALFQHE